MHHDKIAKQNAAGGRMLLDHDKRADTPARKRSNENIDPAKSHLNRDYSLRQMTPGEAWQYAVDYAQAHSNRKIRDNAIVLAEMIVHKPRNWDEVSKGEDPAVFFERLAIPFLRERYGVEDGANEVSAVVHYDETTEHLHYKNVPIAEDGRLSHKAIYTRGELHQAHEDFARYCEERGYPGLDVYDEKRAKKRDRAETMPEYKAKMEVLEDIEQQIKREIVRRESFAAMADDALNEFNTIDKQVTKAKQARDDAKAEYEQLVRQSSEVDAALTAKQQQARRLTAKTKDLADAIDSMDDRLLAAGERISDELTDEIGQKLEDADTVREELNWLLDFVYDLRESLERVLSVLDKPLAKIADGLRDIIRDANAKIQAHQLAQTGLEAGVTKTFTGKEKMNKDKAEHAVKAKAKSMLDEVKRNTTNSERLYKQRQEREEVGQRGRDDNPSVDDD